MHSAILRGTDFEIRSNGQIVRHEEFFSDFTVGTRLGLVSPNGLDGIGDAGLVLGYVTAFYDLHREASDEFYAYPEFRTFQCGAGVADYGMLDIYPAEKNITITSDPESVLHAVIQQEINILLVPIRESSQSKIDSELIESVKATVHTCFLYSPGGEIANPDITITCHKHEIFDWIKEVADSVPDNRPDDQATIPTQPILRQSYLRVSLDTAVKHL